MPAVVAGFEIPAEFMPGGEPEHELNFPREGPGLLEENVRIPFSRLAGEKRCGAPFNFQAVFGSGLFGFL